jgi:hypothetical protein
MCRKRNFPFLFPNQCLALRGKTESIGFESKRAEDTYWILKKALVSAWLEQSLFKVTPSVQWIHDLTVKRHGNCIYGEIAPAKVVSQCLF